jgi:hypothetical protein
MTKHVGCSLKKMIKIMLLLRDTILYDPNILSGHNKLRVVISIINFFA